MDQHQDNHTDVETLLAVTRSAAELLTASPRRAAAISYLKQRGIDARSLPEDEWPLGYAPPGWTRLVDHLRGRYGDDALLDAGLAARSSRGTLIDTFRDRVIFPIHDPEGRTVGFIGRDLSGAPAAPKYLNTRETPIFRKGELLYGPLDDSPIDVNARRLVVMEGPVDVLAVAATAYRTREVDLYPLAACGTAFTSTHARHVESIANTDSHRVIVAMDGDTAGRSAATTAGENLRTAGLDVHVAVLPNGSDPADHLSRTDTDLRFLDQRETLPLVTFHVERAIAAQGDRMQWIEGRLDAAQSIASYLTTYAPSYAFAQASWIARALDLMPTTITTELTRAYREQTVAQPPARGALVRCTSPSPEAVGI